MAVQSVIAAERDQMQIAVRCDAEKIKPGLKGNMIIEAFAERPFLQRKLPPLASLLGATRNL